MGLPWAALLALASAKADEPPLYVEPVVLLDDRLVVAPGKGITAKTADGSSSITLRARVQLRDTYVHEKLDTNELNVRTLRVYVRVAG